jgi:hypothetical protein
VKNYFQNFAVSQLQMSTQRELGFQFVAHYLLSIYILSERHREFRRMSFLLKKSADYASLFVVLAKKYFKEHFR